MEENKMGMYYQTIVAKFNKEDVLSNLGKELLRLEKTSIEALTMPQLEVMFNRTNQVLKALSQFKILNESFRLRVEALKEILQIKINQWKYNLA